MKRRVRKIANFFAFNLLFFALYLNFVHKDSPANTGETATTPKTETAITGTVLVDHPEIYIDKKTETTAPGTELQNETDNTVSQQSTALKLSIN